MSNGPISQDDESKWLQIERQLTEARDALAAARRSGEFHDLQTVGVRCRDILISVAQAVYEPERHKSVDGVEPSRTDFKRMLEAYVAAEFSGEAKREIRKQAQASIEFAHTALDLANQVQHSRTADARRAATCVEATSGVVSFIRIWAGESDEELTISDLIERLLDERKLGSSHRYALQQLARMPIGKKVASRLKSEDVEDHCRKRYANNIKPSTIAQDVSFLRGVLVTARDKWELNVGADAVDVAKRSLEKDHIIGKSVPRTHRPDRDALVRLVSYFTEQARNPQTEIPMSEIMEFALWSARRIGEICRLRWDDLDRVRRTCIVRDIGYRGTRDHEFPLLGKAWDIVQKQELKRKEGEPRIFPYNPKSASISYTNAKKVLGIENLRFDDLRREAARRLFDAGYTLEEVASVTGHRNLDPLYRDLRGQRGAPQAQ